MGLIACYMEADAAIVNELKQRPSEERFEYLEELEEDGVQEVFDMDKMWDAVHYLLTVERSLHLCKKDLLSEAIFGHSILEEEEGILSYSTFEQVALMVEELDKVDTKTVFEHFDPKALKKQGVYPDIWLTVDKEEVAKEMIAAFHGLRAFYHQMAEKKKMVIVSICG